MSERYRGARTPPNTEKQDVRDHKYTKSQQKKYYKTDQHRSEF